MDLLGRRFLRVPQEFAVSAVGFWGLVASMPAAMSLASIIKKPREL